MFYVISMVYLIYRGYKYTYKFKLNVIYQISFNIISMQTNLIENVSSNI